MENKVDKLKINIKKKTLAFQNSYLNLHFFRRQFLDLQLHHRPWPHLFWEWALWV